MVGNCQAKTQNFSDFREEDQKRPVVAAPNSVFDLLQGDPEQAGHQTFICRIVSEEHVTED
jgi:hypothetical protein